MFLSKLFIFLAIGVGLTSALPNYVVTKQNTYGNAIWRSGIPLLQQILQGQEVWMNGRIREPWRNYVAGTSRTTPANILGYGQPPNPAYAAISASSVCTTATATPVGQLIPDLVAYPTAAPASSSSLAVYIVPTDEAGIEPVIYFADGNPFKQELSAKPLAIYPTSSAGPILNTGPYPDQAVTFSSSLAAYVIPTSSSDYPVSSSLAAYIIPSNTIVNPASSSMAMYIILTTSSPSKKITSKVYPAPTKTTTLTAYQTSTRAVKTDVAAYPIPSVRSYVYQPAPRPNAYRPLQPANVLYRAAQWVNRFQPIYQPGLRQGPQYTQSGVARGLIPFQPQVNFRMNK